MKNPFLEPGWAPGPRAGPFSWPGWTPGPVNRGSIAEPSGAGDAKS